MRKATIQMSTDCFQRTKVRPKLVSREPRVKLTGELGVYSVQFFFEREELPYAIKHQFDNQIKPTIGLSRKFNLLVNKESSDVLKRCQCFFNTTVATLKGVQNPFVRETNHYLAGDFLLHVVGLD